MDKNLQEKLFNNFPKLFRQKKLNIYESSMAWGITIKNGWFRIVEQLCKEIQFYLNYNQEISQVEFTQIKEKFGTLRIYFDGGNDYIQGMVHMVESMSSIICEKCGAIGKIITISGWKKCYCEKCAKENKYE